MCVGAGLGVGIGGQENVDVRHRSKFDARIISKCVGSNFQPSRSSRSWDTKRVCTRAAICQIQLWLSGCYVTPNCIKKSAQSVQCPGSWDTKKGVRTCARAAVGQILVVCYCRLYGTWLHTKFQPNRSSGSRNRKGGAHVLTCSGDPNFIRSLQSAVWYLATYQISDQSVR